MQHEWVVGAERDVEALLEVLRKGILIVVQEELVVGQRRHGDAHLREVVEVLQSGVLAQKDAVVDLVGHQVRGGLRKRVRVLLYKR